MPYAVIHNTLEAETKAEKMNQQVEMWCLKFWTEANPSSASFYWGFANHAFNQTLLHKACEWKWDSATQTVTSPNSQSEMAEVAEFESQDWVQEILKSSSETPRAKAYTDPNVAFPFQDDFSVGAMYETNAAKASKALDIKDKLGADGLLYCENHLKLHNKEKKILKRFPMWGCLQ